MFASALFITSGLLLLSRGMSVISTFSRLSFGLVNSILKIGFSFPGVNSTFNSGFLIGKSTPPLDGIRSAGLIGAALSGKFVALISVIYFGLPTISSIG